MAQQALHIAQEIAYPYCIALAQCALGRIAQAQGDDTAAAQHLHAALDVFNTLHMRYEQARTHLLLAPLAHQAPGARLRSRHLLSAGPARTAFGTFPCRRSVALQRRPGADTYHRNTTYRSRRYHAAVML